MDRVKHLNQRNSAQDEIHGNRAGQQQSEACFPSWLVSSPTKKQAPQVALREQERNMQRVCMERRQQGSHQRQQLQHHQDAEQQQLQPQQAGLQEQPSAQLSSKHLMPHQQATTQPAPIQHAPKKRAPLAQDLGSHMKSDGQLGSDSRGSSIVETADAVEISALGQASKQQVISHLHWFERL